MNTNLISFSVIMGLGLFSIFLILLIVAFAVIIIIGLWKLFVKAGKNGWEAIIPFYNYYVLCEVAGLEWYWFIALIGNYIMSILSDFSTFFNSISIIGDIATILAAISVYYNLSKKLHKDTGFVVAGVLTHYIFGPIVLCIAGFSKNYVYDKDVVVDKNGIIEKIINKNSNVQSQPVNNTTANPTNSVVEPNVNNQQENINNNQNNTTM